MAITGRVISVNRTQGMVEVELDPNSALPTCGDMAEFTAPTSPLLSYTTSSSGWVPLVAPTINYLGDLPIEVDLGTSGLPIHTTWEPECICDIRQLMSTGHAASCAWMRWRSQQPGGNP